MTGLNTNIDNYTISEMMSILNIDELNKDNINKSADQLIQQLKAINKGSKLTDFVDNIRQKILEKTDALHVTEICYFLI